MNLVLYGPRLSTTIKYVNRHSIYGFRDSLCIRHMTASSINLIRSLKDDKNAAMFHAASFAPASFFE